MPTHFEQEVGVLKQKLLAMGNYADNAVTRAVQALVNRDEALACKVKADDDILDRLEMEIDEMSIVLLAKAPLATDLRMITMAMKISHELERVGDCAVTIARRASELCSEPQLKPYVDLPHMTEIALEMMKNALNTFVTRDTVAARAIIPRDKQVDALNKQLHRELAGFIVETPSTITRCLNLMVISKSLERIADHAKNIAEDVVFLYEGHDIRHPDARGK